MIQRREISIEIRIEDEGRDKVFKRHPKDVGLEQKSDEDCREQVS